ncbi:MAG: DUF465 domain-containing protein [Deltaproteobacteria bacterium]|nr:DUF465 domain-containing protein [Deltaproteobacteria bacterium]MBW1951657.1 DUF465 domain-containing protein [Deltaproteobacteria bacterium]MBW1985757.1 DUF465 domain-containing protein [Deltaproteobacteria bacterium]MBW2134670.1 DUF465 domain-containing protein [Deltaproteobacteria bacterium]
MEKKDEELIARWIDQDPELKHLMGEHQEFERQLEDLNRRFYLTPEESIARKRIQKLKLAGRDRIEQLLAKYRAKETTS